MTDITFRDANETDLEAVVDMLFEDALGATREDSSRPIPQCYRDAFSSFAKDDNSSLVVAVQGCVVVGCMQLHFLPGISLKGMWRGQIEGVRVAVHLRGKGIGELMMHHAIEQFRERGCGMIQLTTNNTRNDARRFYERLSFVPSHTGMKMMLPR